MWLNGSHPAGPVVDLEEVHGHPPELALGAYGRDGPRVREC